MPSAPDLRPIQRSRLRLAAGRAYYTFMRRMLWRFGGYRFARDRDETSLPHLHAAHATPLLRKLRDVDMQLQVNKITNLRLAAAKLDGILVRPGETFSFWRLVGKTSARKGYLPGLVLFCGGFHAGVGGGLCQLTNLIYWMALHTPLTITERYRHSFDVFPDANRMQPFGSGATCVYPYRDLWLRNDTPDTYQLHIFFTDTHLCGEWRVSSPPRCRYEVFEKDHRMQLEYWGGYSRHNTILRRRFSLPEDELLGEEHVTENHALMMYQPFLPSGE